MERFRADLLEQVKAAQPTTVDPQERREWPQRVATWLYDISHIQVRYSIVYDGIPVERLLRGPAASCCFCSIWRWILMTRALC
jgi:hypothetical protein